MDTTPHTMRAHEVTALCVEGRGPSGFHERWALVVIANLGDRADVTAWRAVTHQAVEKASGLAPLVARESLRRLEAGGWVAVHRNKGYANLYAVNPYAFSDPEPYVTQYESATP